MNASINAFRTALTNVASARGLRLEPYKGGALRSRNIFEIDTQPIFSILYVKISNSFPGFWGLTKNQLDRLQQDKTRFFVVLVARDVTNGYILTGKEVSDKIADGTFELGKDGDYKVNENTDCSSKNSFGGLGAVISRII